MGADLGILVMGTDTGAPIPCQMAVLRDDSDRRYSAVDRQEIRGATALGARRTDVFR